MTSVNWGLVILIVTVVLINFVGLGLILNRKTSSDRKRIEELEGELSEARKELDEYKSQVNDHFMKTSMLFGQMTDSYRAVFMHLADGSKSLCSSDAALLKTTGHILSLDHGQKDTETESKETEKNSDAEKPFSPSDSADRTEVQPESEEVENREEEAGEDDVGRPSSGEAMTESDVLPESVPEEESVESADLKSESESEAKENGERPM